MENNYEQKYKKALDNARLMYDAGNNDVKHIVGQLFHELAESEDEQIRKWIINEVKIKHHNLDEENVDFVDKAIAWLEKQKEYESTDFEYVWDRTDCGELTSALDKYSEEAIINMCHAWYDKGIELERKSWLEKQDPKKHEEELENAYKTADKVQYKRGYEDAIKEMEKQGEKHPEPYNGISFEYNGHIWGMCARDGGVEILMDGNITSRVFPDKNNIIEQKPADSYCQENCKGFQETGKCFADGSCKAKKEAEQKPEENKGNLGGISANPEWSEEDEENFCSVYLDVKSARQNTVNSLSGELKEQEQKRMDEVISWLRTLKGRVLPKQEWNEEDEQHIDSLLKRLDALCRNKFERTRFAISEDRDWLKSLRPQNKWKPSETDIMILEKVFNGKIDPKDFQATLFNVLEQLKKLKEE